MRLGEGIRSRNPNFGDSTIIMFAGAYYYTALHAFDVCVAEMNRMNSTGTQNSFTLELAHFSPALSNMAFACELAFKSLLSESDRNKTHNLKDLYDLIDSGDREYIKGRAIAENEIIKNDSEFDIELTRCGNDFVTWRYIYEPHGEESVIGAFSFIKSMVKAVFDMYGIEYDD